jgi:hypothetical protein
MYYYMTTVTLICIITSDHYVYSVYMYVYVVLFFLIFVRMKRLCGLCVGFMSDHYIESRSG